MGKKRKLFNCLIYLIYMVLGSAVFFGIKGYGMYREAIKEEPIDLRIEKKRSQKDFVGVCQESAISLYRQGIFRFPALLFPRDPEDNPVRGDTGQSGYPHCLPLPAVPAHVPGW